MVVFFLRNVFIVKKKKFENLIFFLIVLLFYKIGCNKFMVKIGRLDVEFLYFFRF